MSYDTWVTLLREGSLELEQYSACIAVQFGLKIETRYRQVNEDASYITAVVLRFSASVTVRICLPWIVLALLSRAHQVARSRLGGRPAAEGINKQARIGPVPRTPYRESRDNFGSRGTLSAVAVRDSRRNNAEANDAVSIDEQRVTNKKRWPSTHTGFHRARLSPAGGIDIVLRRGLVLTKLHISPASNADYLAVRVRPLR